MKVFVRLDCAASPSGIVGRNKIASVPRASSIVVAKSATAARTGTTTGSLSDRSIFLVGHVCEAVSIDRPFIVLTETKPSKRHIPVWARYSPLEAREVDASPAACDRKGAAAWITLALTSLLWIKHAVRVHQGSLIRYCGMRGIQSPV